MFCMHCGAKLPDNAKFCFQCGEKVGGAAAPVTKAPPASAQTPRPAAAPAAAAQQAQGKNEASSLDQLFASLDPVVCHSEYYFINSNPMLNGYSMAVNGKWVLKHVSHFPDDEFTLMDDEGGNVQQLDVRPKLRKAEYKNLMGFNTHGVWFLVRSQVNEVFINVKFICVDVVRGRTYEYPIEHQNGTISDVYIYGNELCYINDTSDFKQYLHRMTLESSTEVFSSQTKAERIFRLSMTAGRIAWGYTSSREGKERWYWYFFDKATEQLSYISAPHHPDRTSQPLIDIMAVDLAKGMLFTGLSEREAEHYGMAADAIAARKIEDPAEFRVLTYKSNQQPAIWNVKNEGDRYFDSSVFYVSPEQAELDRYDRFGERFILGRTGKGACRNFLVTDKWIFLNYDARDLVRLPKNFAACTEYAAENPEAFFIFGKGVNFRI